MFISSFCSLNIKMKFTDIDKVNTFKILRRPMSVKRWCNMYKCQHFHPLWIGCFSLELPMRFCEAYTQTWLEGMLCGRNIHNTFVSGGNTKNMTYFGT